MVIFEKDSNELNLKDLDNGNECHEHSGISWLLYAEGFVGEEVLFPADGYYKFDILARGTEEFGEWTRLAFKINDELVLPRIIECKDLTKYTFVASVKAGVQKISFHFEHDIQVDKVKLESGNAKITPMTNTYVTGGYGIYVGKLEITKLTSGRVITVPCQKYPNIQSAINASLSGDTVRVNPGTYNEQIILKEGVILVSNSDGEGADIVNVTADDNIFITPHENAIIEKKIFRRSLVTIIDGTGFPSYENAVPMVDFPEGLTESTILDGFTITNMPNTEHSSPHHVSTVQCCGSSPTILNNFIYNNNSTGICIQASFLGENLSYENIKYGAQAIIKNNIFFRNSSAGIGSDYYSHSIIFDNECAGNFSVACEEAPGIGIQHGAHPIVEANLSHHNDWSGISSRKGSAHNINRPTHPSIRKNICYRNGLSMYDENRNLEHGAGIGIENSGNKIHKVVIEQNICNENQMAGIGIRGDTQAIIRENNSYTNKMSGIGINGSASSVLVKGNIVCHNEQAGIACMNGASPVIFGNMLYSNLLSGVGLNESGKAKLLFNQIYENKLSGVGITNGSNTESISGNNIFKNGTTGISLSNDSCLEKIEENRIFKNQRPGIALLPGSSVKKIEHNTIDNNGLSGSPNIVIFENNTGDRLLVLTGNSITNNNYVNIRIDKSNLYLEENVIAGSRNTGVVITGNSKIMGNKNVITDNGGTGIVVKSSKLEIYHSTFYKNAYRLGAAVVSIDSEVVLKNNIFSKNKIGIAGDFAQISMDCNCFWESFVPPICDKGFESIEENPQFVDENENDFRLIRESPCIDKGERISEVNDSFLGDGPDIGAYQWDGTT